MTPTVVRFLRVLIIAGVATAGLVAFVDSSAVKVGSVVALCIVVAVAHVRIVASAVDESVSVIENEDPDAPITPGPIAEAVRSRVGAERLAREKVSNDLRQSVEAAGVGVLIVERDGRVLASVGATQPVLPVGPDLAVKSPAVLELLAEALDDDRVVVDTFVMGARSRSYQWVAAPLEDGAVGAVITDVTERDRVQAMRRSFITDASHELKTPIAAIQAGAEALQMAIGRDEERARHFAHRLEEQAVRLGRLVSDLLDLSRLESDEPELVRLDLRGVVAPELENARVEAGDEGITLVGHLAAVEIEGVASDLALAVRNVLGNAVKYTPAGGRITVWMGERDGRAIVEVTDTGIGIPTAEQDRIFHRFHRVDAARSRATGGTGLGLAIVRHVVDRHGGSVAVRSVVGHGSTFTLDLGDALH